MHRRVDDEIALVDYYPAYDTALAWYQDPQLCRQVDNLDGVYSLEKLKAMYTYLTTYGECYYIEYNGKLVGDAALVGDTVCLVVCREYQNRHIGRRCVQALAELAAEKGRTRLRARICPFNKQSQAMFRAAGFTCAGDDWYLLPLPAAAKGQNN
ncbi:MAG TPA: GNAT family N-acetyltransferase [Candidatus Anaerofilum faecale]|nr:GNAT family N-acetyltransferase [Candidatus Anaerofilum faecale]